jgi:drug/metabolite transporter (DMT)-like permease
LREAAFAGVACGCGAALIWAGQASVSAYGVRGTFTALDVTALRVMVAGTLVLMLIGRRIGATVQRLGVWRSVALALGAGAPYPLLSISGLQYSTVPHAAAILSGCVPLFAALLTWLLMGQAVSRRWAAGFALVAAGLIAVVQPYDAPPAPDYVLGDSLFALAALGFAAFGVLARRWQVGALEATGVATSFSLLYVPVYLALFVPAEPQWEAAGIMLQAVYQGLLAAIVAVVLYLKSTETLGPERAALFVAAVPGAAVLIGALVVGDVPAPTELVGIAMLSTGIVLCLRRPRPGS